MEMANTGLSCVLVRSNGRKHKLGKRKKVSTILLFDSTFDVLITNEVLYPILRFSSQTTRNDITWKEIDQT